MRVLSLCSGYGGLELALGALFPDGVNTTAVCDNYGPARRTLNKRFPEAAVYSDVHDPLIELETADVVTFGFPCQDLSRPAAGLDYGGAGVAFSSGASRSETPRVPTRSSSRTSRRRFGTARPLMPSWGATGSPLDGGGRARAEEVGLPHRRDRVFIVASRVGGSQI